MRLSINRAESFIPCLFNPSLFAIGIGIGWSLFVESAFSQNTDAPLWSLRTLQRPTVPKSAVDTWSISDIDRFVFEKLQSVEMTPAQDAAPATLLRRVHFDLVGLPPSLDDVENFMNRMAEANFENALSDEVDRLIASDAFGERWGRHWLDVARFAESSGKEANISFPYAWRYRDYVIDCFNQDVPFDRFLVEQIAGDLLPHANEAERARLLIATGFLALGPKNLDEGNPVQFAADLVDEQIDTVSRAFMAHSIACARCHDHKADPYTMEDYYGLAGIFASTTTYFGTAVSPANRMAGDPLVLPKLANQPILQKSIPAKQVVELKNKLAAMKKEQEEGMAAVSKAVEEGRDASEIFTLRDALRIFWSSGGIEGQLEQVDENGKALPLAMGVLEAPKLVDAPLLERGEITQPTQPISRRLPQPIPTKTQFTIDANESGRLQLARWLTDSSHPLTARVIANRIWHYLMGSGLVSTVDDFGSTGQPPSHPELLDYLAFDLMKDSWSIKRQIRRIVLSRVYRQSSAFNPTYFERDPDNRLLWRASKRRLDAEVIRDAMLAASGELNMSRPLGSLVANTIGDRPISLIGLDERIPHDLDGSVHRSVYLPVLRDRLPDALSMFDFAEPSLVTGARESTNVPVQALYLMNSDFVRARSIAIAKSVLQSISIDHKASTEYQVDRLERFIQIAFQKCFGRIPDGIESKLANDYLKSQMTEIGKDNNEVKVLARYCQALFASAEFRNVD
jgi:Protein of unknown function (DUF1553)/Protein of unknown function (DUF1549)